MNHGVLVGTSMDVKAGSIKRIVITPTTTQGTNLAASSWDFYLIPLLLNSIPGLHLPNIKHGFHH
jgi:hypothetical protein